MSGSSAALLGHLLEAAEPGCVVEVGARVECGGFPDVTVSEASTVRIGDGVTIRRDVEMRATKGSTIEVADGAKIDRGVRIIATNGSRVMIGAASAIGIGSVLNGGDSITIGELCLISGYVYLQTSMHRHERGVPIRHQGFDHAPIVLGDDVWLGAHVAVLPGCTLGNGAVVGSNAVVRCNLGENEIWAGVPARKVGDR